jgi:hypothetical protein
MSSLDGDKIYADIKTKVAAGEPLTKQDLMSIVFLPMMKNSVDKATRFEHAITLSKEISAESERAQIQEMLKVLAEKFITEDIRYEGGNGKPPKISWQRLIRSGLEQFLSTKRKGGQYVKLVGITA